MSAPRPLASGKTRTCPHCKAVILESLSICPGCLHHLRFDSEAAKRQVAANSALRVEGVIRHPPLEEPWEYYVVIAVRNDKGEEVTRQVVSVGTLQPAEKRTFSLAVEVLPPRAPPEPEEVKPAAKPQPNLPPGQASPYNLKPPGLTPSQGMQKPAATPSQGTQKPAPQPAAPPAKPPAAPGLTPAQAAGLKPPPIGGGSKKR
jgi:hypothetical protein